MKFKEYNIAFLSFIGFIIIVVICIFNNEFVNKQFSTWEEKGNFGDSFGLANTIISGLAFTSVLLSLYFQRQDLSLQRDELSLTRQELEGQKEELKKQNETLIQQQFESTFFNLLSNHHQILININEIWQSRSHGIRSERELKGRELFDAITIFVEDAYKNNSGSFNAKFYPIFNYQDFNEHFIFETDDYKNLESIDKVKHLYHKIYELNRSSLGHYYRNLFHIVKFVDEYEGFNFVLDKDKAQKIKYNYIRILRAQLSTNEIIVLWYNSMMSFGKEWEKYLKDYKLLKNVDMNANIALPKEMIKQYPYLNEN